MKANGQPSRNQIYHVFRAKGGVEWGLVLADCKSETYQLLSHDVDGQPMRLEAEFMETSWLRAKEAYELVMETWEPDACPERKDGGPHEFERDYEYDSTGETINCVHCGAEEQ